LFPFVLQLRCCGCCGRELAGNWRLEEVTGTMLPALYKEKSCHQVRLFRPHGGSVLNAGAPGEAGFWRQRLSPTVRTKFGQRNSFWYGHMIWRGRNANGRSILGRLAAVG